MLNNLGEYQIWQGKNIRELLAFVNLDDFNEEIENPKSSLRDEVVHIIAALETCFARINGDLDNFHSKFRKLKEMDKNELMTHWELVEEKFKEKVEQIDSDGGSINISNITDKTYQIPIKDYFTHYILHSNYHRAHIMWILRTLGYKTATLDYILYFNDTVIYSD